MHRKKKISFKKKINELCVNLAVFLVVLVILMIILEVGVRILWKDERGNYGRPIGLEIPDATKGFAYQPNYTGAFVGAGYEDVIISTNSEGLRDHDHNITKDKNDIRILVIGDSVTFGAGVKENETFPNILESRLNNNFKSKNSPRAVEIINGGVGGYEIREEHTIYLERLRKYHPDIVVIQVTLNDARLSNYSEVLLSFNNSISFRAKLNIFISDNIKTLKLLYRIYMRLFVIGDKDYNQDYFEKVYSLWSGETWESYKNELTALNHEITSDNASVIMVIFPYTQQFNHSINYGTEPQKKIAALGRALNMTVIDVTPILDRNNYKELYLPYDNVHLSFDGQLLVAHALEPYFTQHILDKTK